MKSPGSFLYSAVGGEGWRAGYYLSDTARLRARLQFASPFLFLFISASSLQGAYGGEWGDNKLLSKRPCAGCCRKLKNFNLHFDI